MTEPTQPEDVVRVHLRPVERETRWQRRQRRIREEIARNRRGEAAIPTWLLAVLLVVVVGGWLAFIIAFG